MVAADMAHELDEISRVLGGIESTLRDFSRRFDRIETRDEQRDEALNIIQDQVESLVTDTRYLKEVLVDDVKPVTDDVKRWRLMGLGALGIIGIGGTAFGAGMLWLLNQLGWVKVP